MARELGVSKATVQRVWSENEIKPHLTRVFKVLRCFLLIVSELGHSWNSQVELARSLVGYGSEVDEVFKSPSHSFG
jgi:hypothetical protein